MSDEENAVSKSVANAVNTIGKLFFASLSEVFKRRAPRDDERHDLSPESQRIQDMWRTGDFGGYNAAVAANLRSRGLAPNGQPLRSEPTGVFDRATPDPKAEDVFVIAQRQDKGTLADYDALVTAGKASTQPLRSKLRSRTRWPSRIPTHLARKKHVKTVFDQLIALTDELASLPREQRKIVEALVAPSVLDILKAFERAKLCALTKRSTNHPRKWTDKQIFEATIARPKDLTPEQKKDRRRAQIAASSRKRREAARLEK
jgi:hypothetical protein